MNGLMNGSRALRFAALAAAMAVGATVILAGCASQPPKQEETKLVWPPPPEIARIKFMRSIVSEKDLDADTMKALDAAIAAFKSQWSSRKPEKALAGV